MAYGLVSLGRHKFFVPLPGTDTPNIETISRDTSYSWVSQQRLSRSPAMQFTGAGEEVLSFEGRLFPMHFGGLSTLSGLRASADAGDILTMIQWYPRNDQFVLAGEERGRYVITRIRSNDSNIGAWGVPHKVDFTIELKQFGDDNLSFDVGRDIDYRQGVLDQGGFMEPGDTTEQTP